MSLHKSVMPKRPTKMLTGIMHKLDKFVLYHIQYDIIFSMIFGNSQFDKTLN